MVFIKEDGSLRILGMGVKAALGVELFEAVVSSSISPLASSETQGRLSSFDVMSPEYRSGVPEDSQVDVYGAGVIGYWLLTGRKPSQQHLQVPSVVQPGLSDRWDEFFVKALSRDRSERYASCRAALLVLKDSDDEDQSKRVGGLQRQIDRIPTPKSIFERGDLAVRIYRLSLIGVVGLTLMALTSFWVSSVFEDEAPVSNEPVKLIAEGRPRTCI